MRILFMTVGTGIGGKEDKIKSLAHGLLTSILHYNPDKIIFFGSKDSISTIDSIKEQYFENKGEELNNYEFVEIEDIDNFYDCYSKIEEKIKENKKAEIIIDYTSGTKTMTTSAAIAAMLYQKKLSLVSGKRENGIVIKGTEEAKEQNLFAAYDKYMMDKAKEAINSYRYEDANIHLSQVVADKEKDTYQKIVEAYSLWDKFNHDEAWEILKEIKHDALDQNKKFLGMMMNDESKEIVEEFLIPDLLNNAWRRMEEGKYDDAVARLYRCIEMIAQYRLKSKYNLDTSKIIFLDLRSKLPEDNELIEKWRNKSDDKGIIKLALQQDYELLRDLGDDIGYLMDERLKDLLKKRNESILAHGIKPIPKEDAEKLYEKTVEIASKVIKDLKEKMEMAKFPKL